MRLAVQRQQWNYWLAAGGLLCVCMMGVVLYLTQGIPMPRPRGARATNQEELSTTTPKVGAIEVVQPQYGITCVWEQPVAVHAAETVQLHAQVSGIVTIQNNIDIGDRVKKGQVLAVIAVPELDKRLARNKGSREQAKARVAQMEARVASARADQDLAKGATVQAEAAFKSAAAWVRYRKLQYQRMQDLFKIGTITDEQVVDKIKQHYEASLETERAAKAAINTSMASVAATAAKINLTEADVAVAEAEVRVARAEQETTQARIDYATIRAPFDGEISHRAFFPGGWVRSASEGTSQQPLLTVQRVDMLRVLVQVPGTTVPYLIQGDPVIVRIDALSGMQFAGVVSRTSGTVNGNPHLMHVEVDLPNPTGEIGDGMHGTARIVLERFPKLLSIPLSCVVKTDKGGGVFVVRDGRAQFLEVRLGTGNGRRITVLNGLRVDDRVVRNSSAARLVEGVEVQTNLVQDPPAKDEP